MSTTTSSPIAIPVLSVVDPQVAYTLALPTTPDNYEIRVVSTTTGDVFMPFINGEPVTPPPASNRSGTNVQLNRFLDLVDYGCAIGIDVETQLADDLLEAVESPGSWSSDDESPIQITKWSPPSSHSCDPTPSSSDGSESSGPHLDEYEEFIECDTGIWVNGQRVDRGSTSKRPRDDDVTCVPDSDPPVHRRPMQLGPCIEFLDRVVARKLSF